MTKFLQDKARGSSAAWTKDLWIMSQTLYHWARQDPHNNSDNTADGAIPHFVEKSQASSYISNKLISLKTKSTVRIHQPFFRTFFVLFSRFFYIQIHLNETHPLIG